MSQTIPITSYLDVLPKLRPCLNMRYALNSLCSWISFIYTWVNFMLAAPESLLQDDLDTIELCRKAKVTYPAYSITVPMKGTQLYDYCVETSLIDPSVFEGDMSGCSLRPTLPCFTEKEKDIRYNIYLVGALIAKLPFPLNKMAIGLIKTVPPNTLFKKIHSCLYRYYISNRIFKL